MSAANRGARVTAIVGDIVRQPDCEAIVNAANPQLLAGGGVCGAIHRAVAPTLKHVQEIRFVLFAADALACFR